MQTNPSAGVKLRHGTIRDLPRANAVVKSAIATWHLPQRVKRLVWPSYRYTPGDLDYQLMMVAEHRTVGIVGIAVWEPADSAVTPNRKTGLLLHGLYVTSEFHLRGIGTQLLRHGVQAARESGFGGLLVKANRESCGFFKANGLRPQAVRDPNRDYPYRFWMEIENISDASNIRERAIGHDVCGNRTSLSHKTGDVLDVGFFTKRMRVGRPWPEEEIDN